MPDADTPAAELVELIRADPIDTESLSKRLDAWTHEERVVAVRGLGRKSQRRLYAAVEGLHPLGLADLVPASVPELGVVRHFGRNTLPAFTHFEKRFCRPSADEPGECGEPGDHLYGFNFQALQPLTGPGYFVAREAPDRPEILIDYTEIPSALARARPDAWPEVRSNEVGLARFVYGFMVDTLRRVSEHVTIGSAARNGRDIGSWFVLCREPR